ncbi:gametogenetin-binding protein 2 [Corythoichthys intestinalis]|uniref:gametogenetin-binding protein 2 n=1 Tax=Corythoichthys intestinalis TaxID=161448 RepID=UPI0025A56422|nr:gametogenetin-binding protein 2 [Corythoichthys intestinalis]XP_061801609.1 gametogenetin-binding protein 2-like [Nerophis lumbriciformis]
MARLVAVCEENEEDYPFLTRQIPLYIDDSLTMVMEFPDVMDVDRHISSSSHWKQFTESHSKLKQPDLSVALSVVFREFCKTLSQLVPCVGCRRSVERLFTHLSVSGTPALEPLTFKPMGILSVTETCLSDLKKLYSLFYIQGSKLNDVIDAIPKSKKSNRCLLHSLDTNKLRPSGGSLMDLWERMSQECWDEVVLIDSACFLESLKIHLQKHRFCSDCKSKVLRAYNILVGEVDSSEEKDFCPDLYEGLYCCSCDRHIHVCCEIDFIAHLLGRAEAQFAGGYEERHAKTIDLAQKEVLTCLGIYLHERLQKIWQKLRAEEQTWQLLFHVGIDEIRKSFETAVERTQGLSRLEQFVEELSEKERAKQLKQEKKRQKRKNRRRNKCGFDISEQEADIKEENHEEGSVDCEEPNCTACGNLDNRENISNASTTFSCSDKPDSTGSDYGYSSSFESSSREGSDVACSEGLCNHDVAVKSNECGFAEEKEEATDSCSEFWTHTEETPQCKSRKKKRKGSALHNNNNNQGRRDESHSLPPPHVCQTKDLKLDRFAQQLPWAGHGKNHCLNSKQLEANMSLLDLMDDSEVISDEENGLTQDEIQAFVERNGLFYSNRHKYRQLLKDKFTNYCCASHSKIDCSNCFASTSVKSVRQ